MNNAVQGLVEQLSKAEARDLFNKIIKSKKLKKSPTYVKFPTPVDEVRTGGVSQVCVSRNDVIRHLGEFLLEDLDKMSTIQIKSKAIEMLMFLSEFDPTEETKRRTLARAVKILMEFSRDRLMYKIATLATLNP